jgi:hypothetical protein
MGRKFLRLTAGREPLPAGPFTVGTNTIQIPGADEQRRGFALDDEQACLLVRATRGAYKFIARRTRDADTTSEQRDNRI